MAQHLSEDLLYAIFLHALPSNLLLTAEGAWHEPKTIAPLNFSLVCRSWRTLVLSRPKLWSEIRVENEVGWRMHYHCRFDWSVIRKWLFHSSPALLQIHIYTKDPSGHLTEDLLQLFIPEHLRWNSFYLRADIGTGLVPLVLKTNMLRCSPPLSSLSLHLNNIGRTPLVYVDLSQTVGDTCPLLEYLNVDVGAGVRLPQCRDTLCLPRLRSFQFKSAYHNQDLEDLWCILSASPKLEDLVITCLKQLAPPTPNRDTVHLPRLSSLTLTTSSRNITNYLFNILICPSLSHLAFRIYGPVGIEVGDKRVFLEPRHIYDFFLRSGSGSRLEILELGWVGGWDDGDPALRDLLFSLLNLKILELRARSLRRVVFEMLSVLSEAPRNDQKPYPCPFLSEIRLCYEPPILDWDSTEEAMDEMIVSRWKAGNLRAVTLKFPQLYHGKIKERTRIAECIEEGLTVTEESFDYWT
ncbi:hypothetical protein SCHPADRAFT_900559 [Schizopora paradoxa]|uniref:F-box domain-containing protein n=1 Tax=Schizopora paradoxa TaxID=27342 RepID=A0A0H2SK55_9AGAM|nr:hypothetical protein SCHPADRAFT_900559 [Schizopora paradoxa]